MQQTGWSGVARGERGGVVDEHVSGERVPGHAVTASTRFQGGSVAKLVTAIAALRQVELGAVDLHAPIGDLVDGLPRPIAHLTLHQLLSHTSGFGHWPDLPELDMADPPEGGTLLRMILERPLAHPTGTWHYSNFGYLVAARVVATAASAPYADVVRDAVLAPAGMSRSSSGEFPVGGDDAAVGHRDGAALATSPTPTSIPGTGDLWTTAADLVRLSRALHGGELLRPDSLSALLTPHATFPAAEIADPRIVADGYGYGTWLGAVRGERAAIQPGDNDGYRSMLVHPLGADLHLAILTNDDGPTLARPLDLLLEG